MRLDLKRLALRISIRAQHLVHLLARPMTLGVRAIALDAQSRVLLVRHSYVPGWHFPGGGVEPGETALTSLARELREEAGVECDGEPALFGVYFNRRVSRRDHVLLYVVRTFRRIETPKPNWEIVESGFFPVRDLPAGSTAAVRARLAELLDAAPRAPNW